MRNIALKYGILGGALITIPMFFVIPNIDSIDFQNGTTILFLTMIISFISVFLGISSVRKNVGGGFIGFRYALITGISITVITSVFYTLASLLLFYVMKPDFNEKLSAFMLEQMKANHSSAAEIEKFTADAGKQLSNKNMIINAAYILMTPMKFGLFFTLTSTLILRRKAFPGMWN